MDNGHEVFRALGRIEGRIEQFLSTQAQQNGRLDDHDERLTTLEAGRNRGTGFLAGVACLGGGGISLIVWVAEHFLTR